MADKPLTAQFPKTTSWSTKPSKHQLVVTQESAKALPKRSSLKKSQSNLESNTFHSKRNTLNTIKSKELKEFHTKEKSSNTKKLPELKESPSKEPSLTTTLLKPKSNTFPRKLKKLSLNTNQLKESGNEFNTCQSKLKSSTTLKETTTLLDKANTSRPATSREDTLQATNKV
jgi:hypothetical protein